MSSTSIFNYKLLSVVDSICNELKSFDSEILVTVMIKYTHEITIKLVCGYE